MQTSLQVTSTPRPAGNAERPQPSSFEETWEETLLIPPLDFVPMWGQTESGDCCGFIVPKWSEQSGRVAKHGTFQLNRDKMQIKETKQAAHVRMPKSTERSTEKNGAEEKLIR